MPGAARVVLAPPGPWDEPRLLDAARALPQPEGPMRPGDEVGGLVVIGVDPEPGATAERSTAFEVVPEARVARAAMLDVAVLLDASDSMAQPWSDEHTRFAAARIALQAFLRDPARHLRLVSLFLYSKESQLVAGPVASPDVLIPDVKPRGRAQTGSALNAALAYLAANASPHASQSVVILSDGAGQLAELERAAERAKRLRVPVHVLLFAPADDASFEAAAAVTGGTYARATLPLSFTLAHEDSHA